MISCSSAARLLLERRLLGRGHRAHFGVGGGVGDQGLETLDLADDVAIVPHRLDHGTELGEFARELDIGLGRHLGRKLAFDRPVAGEQRVEFLFRKHRHLD